MSRRRRRASTRVVRRRSRDDQWDARFDSRFGASMLAYYTEPRSYLGSSLSPAVHAGTVRPLRTGGGDEI